VTGLPPHLEETVIFDGRFQCIQPRCGFRFSVDALLLAWFVLRNGAGGPFCELGAGSGVISALLARSGMADGVAVELDSTMLEALNRTISCNGLERSITVCPNDLRELRDVLDGDTFRTVVANPPYFPVGEGRVNASAADAGARHEFTCTMSDVLAASRFLLPDRGRLFLIYPALRLAECLSSLETCELRPTRLQLVHPRAGRRASHFIVEAAMREGPELVVESPQVIHADGTSAYGGWYEELLGRIEE